MTWTAEQRRRNRGPYKPVVPPPPIPSLHQGHPLLERARQIAAEIGAHEDHRDHVYDPAFDDIVGTITLALLEGCCPYEAVRAWRTRENSWRFHNETGISPEREIRLTTV